MKTTEETYTGPLLMGIGLAFIIELIARARGFGWSGVPGLILPGLAAYCCLGLIFMGLGRVAGRILGRERPGRVGLFLGLALVLVIQATVWVADNFGGLPMLGGSRLVATVIGVVVALALALLAAWLLARLSRIAWARYVGRVMGFVIVPLGLAVLVLSPLLGWHTLPHSPKNEPQPAVGSAPAGPNLILISIDTLRADALPAYGETRLTTPNIDRLLPGSRRFTNLRSTAPLTLPAHAGMLTGRHPTELGIVSNGGTVPADTPTVGGLAGQAGLTTAAIVSTPVLDPETGLDAGFRTYLAPYPRHTAAFRLGMEMALGRLAKVARGDVRPLSNAATTGYAVDWLEANQDRRFFLFLHYWGTHDPYRPPWRFYFSDLRSDGVGRRFGNPGRYRGEVLYVDEQMGILFDRIKDLGLWDKTTIIFTADHGEGLGEHGYLYHAREVYEEQLRVPLIIKPAQAQAQAEPKIEAAHIQSEMVAHLCLAALGLAGEPPLEDSPAGAVSTGARKGTLILGPQKLIADPGRGRWEAFDLEQDPEEARNLAQPKAPWPDMAGQLLDWLGEAAASGSESLSSEREKALKALGYL